MNACHYKQTSRYHISEIDVKFTFNLHRHVTGSRLKWVLESCADLNFLSTPASPPSRIRRNLRNPACSRPSLADFQPALVTTCNTPKPYPSRTASVPTLHQSWGKPLKTHAMCFIDSGNSFSGSFQSQRNLETHYKAKEWNLVKLQGFTSLSALHCQSTTLKSMSFTQSLTLSKLLFCDPRHDHWYQTNTRSLVALVAIVKNVLYFVQDHRDQEAPTCGLATSSGECPYISNVKPEVCMLPRKL